MNSINIHYRITHELPSGKHTKNYGRSPCFMGKLTISMVIFHSYVPEGNGFSNRGLMLSNDTYFTYYPMIHGYIIYVQMVDM